MFRNGSAPHADLWQEEAPTVALARGVVSLGKTVWFHVVSFSPVTAVNGHLPDWSRQPQFCA
jgi:hypothetical protein